MDPCYCCAFRRTRNASYVTPETLITRPSTPTAISLRTWSPHLLQTALRSGGNRKMVRDACGSTFLGVCLGTGKKELRPGRWRWGETLDPTWICSGKQLCRTWSAWKSSPEALTSAPSFSLTFFHSHMDTTPSNFLNTDGHGKINLYSRNSVRTDVPWANNCITNG